MTYKVKFVSQTNALIFIITALAAFLVIAGTCLPAGGLQSKGLSILLVSIQSIIAYILWQILVTGRTEWTIDKNEISIVWTKKFFLADDKDIRIKWSEIKNISRGTDSMYYLLKIELLSGDILKYFHDTLTTRDEFRDMLEVLDQTFHDKKNPQPI